jgi:hypothetical protein
MLRICMVKYCRLTQQATSMTGLGIVSIQDMMRDEVTLLLELISAIFIGLHSMPIVNSSLIPRHNNCHRSWGVPWVKKVTNDSVEL